MLIQAEYILYEAAGWGGSCRFSPEVILELQRLAVNQIYRCAGHFRNGLVFIEGGTHQPPGHSEVVSNVEAMCAYVNRNWQMGKVLDSQRSQVFAGTVDRPGLVINGKQWTNDRKRAVYQTQQTFVIEGETYTY